MGTVASARGHGASLGFPVATGGKPLSGDPKKSCPQIFIYTYATVWETEINNNMQCEIKIRAASRPHRLDIEVRGHSQHISCQI